MSAKRRKIVAEDIDFGTSTSTIPTDSGGTRTGTQVNAASLPSPWVGNFSITGSLTASTTVTAADVTATDDVTVGDDLIVSGLATIAETLAVTGNITGSATITGSDLTATDDVTVGDDLIVSGLATIAETLAVTQSITAGTSITGADLAATDDLTVGDDAAITGDLTVGGATAVASLQCDSIVNDTGLASGTYTPTLTNTTNVAASTAFACPYIRVGNVVTVGLVLQIDPTAAVPTATELQFTLPVASNFGATTDGAGCLNCSEVPAQTAVIQANVANDRGSIQYSATSVANSSFWGTFVYTVI